MQRSERWPDESEEDRPSRPSSRRNSGSLSRRGSVKKEAEVKKTTSSASSTPKKVPKPPSLGFVVTGKQIAKRSDRINSLPGAYYRRPSADSIVKPKKFDLTKKFTQASKSRDASLEDDMSLDLSQVSDFEDTNSKYGFKQKFAPLATSSPKRPSQKPRSCSLQNQVLQKEAKKSQRSLDSKSRQSTFSYSNSYKTSASPYRQGVSTDRDCSSVSPEYSAPSSGESAPEAPQDNLISPKSQDFMDSSFCVSWQDCSEAGVREGEWSHFWANYNNSLARVPVSRYYDQCPTPYRTEDFELADLEFSTDGSRKRSPENINTINNIICNEGLHLTPRETQNMIKCAHILSNVLTKAIERRTKDDIITEKIEKIQEIDPEKELKKKTMSLDLKETVLPLEVKEEKRWETVTTQTDISLPNTKSAPKIFEKILRQLSKTSIDVPDKEKVAPEKEKKEATNGEAREVVKEVTNGT